MTTDNDLIRRGGVRKEINRALAWSPYAGGTTESVAFREGGMEIAKIIDEAIAALPAATPALTANPVDASLKADPVVNAALVLLADSDAVTDIAVQIVRTRKQRGVRPALIDALRAIAREALE